MPISLRPCRVLALAAVLLLLGLAAGCSDQGREQPPAAAANATAANATAANATAANAIAAGPGEANATLAVADVLAPNGSLLAPDLSPEAANATLAACALPAPAKPEKTLAKPEKGSAKLAKTPARPAQPVASARAPAAPAGPLTLERAHEEFASFARQWLASLSRNMLGTAAHMAVSAEGSGYVARFAEVEQGGVELEVKATDSPTCPYVGILKYFECSYESHGDSPELAKAGTFAQVRKVRVTELFRHSGRRWE